MSFLSYLAIFFAGAFLCNCIPHLACGLSGVAFPTPFAQPRGIGDSSPTINFAWGFANLLVGICLYSRFPAAVGVNPEFLLFLAGFLVLGLYLSRHFGAVRLSKKTQ